MNFLAHLHLAPDRPDQKVGSVVADFLKGPAFHALPAAIQDGVRHHRAVDAFTDRHALVQRSIVRISMNWGWFSGIIVDVYYDHLLARDWARYSSEPLRGFADRMYAILGGHAPELAMPGRGFIEWFVKDDRLLRYGTVDGIADTLARLSRRIAERIPNRAVRLEDAMPELIANDTGLEADFRAFYPELMAFAREWGHSRSE
jgi:acyl carrier protein phosphodiesterase